jgi:CRISPR/Cas system CMR subunit Cmr4 (Cas7 group RAMP superfamily)
MKQHNTYHTVAQNLSAVTPVHCGTGAARGLEMQRRRVYFKIIYSTQY